MNTAQILLNLPDIPRIYTALAEWLACVLCILEMKRKFSGWKLIMFSVLGLIIQVFFLEVTAKIDVALWMLCMALAIALMYLFMYLCCEENMKDVGYY